MIFVVAEQTEQQLSTVCKQVLVTWENCQLNKCKFTPITKTLARGVMCKLGTECKQTVLQSVPIPSCNIPSHRVLTSSHPCCLNNWAFQRRRFYTQSWHYYLLTINPTTWGMFPVFCCPVPPCLVSKSWGETCVVFIIFIWSIRHKVSVSYCFLIASTLSLLK